MQTATANEITSKLLLAIPERLPARAWRRNTGGGYPVAVVQQAIGMLRRGLVQETIAFLARARVVHFGLPGEPDIDGLVGPNGRRLGVEVKAGRDKQSEQQLTCERIWKKHGAIYIVARDVDEAIAAIIQELGL